MGTLGELLILEFVMNVNECSKIETRLETSLLIVQIYSLC
jgi:hypothetical protein